MRQRLVAPAVAAYLVVALYTFGHAAAASERYAERDRAICLDRRRGDICAAISLSAVPALIGAALWPLYWSWELQG